MPTLGRRGHFRRVGVSPALVFFPGGPQAYPTVDDITLPIQEPQSKLLIQEPHQLLAPAGLLELADGFGLDLADALAGDLEDVADLFQRIAVAVPQAIAQ